MQVGPNVNTKHGGKIPGSSKSDGKSKSTGLDQPVEIMPFSNDPAGNSSNGATPGSIAESLKKSTMKSNAGQ